MKTRCKLVERVAMMRKLGYSVCAQIVQHRSDLRGIDADVLPSIPIRSGPAPGFSEHPLVQSTGELARQQVPVRSSKRPTFTIQDVAQFPLVELPLCDDVLRDQSFGFVGVEWGRARRVLEFQSHSLRGLPRSRASARNLRWRSLSLTPTPWFSSFIECAA